MQSGSTLQGSQSSVGTSSPSPLVIATGGHNRPAPFITVEVYENQRWFPLSKWSSTKRLPPDRPHFSNKRGTEELSLTAYKLPKGYAWGSLPNTPAGAHEGAKAGAGFEATGNASVDISSIIGNAWQLEILENTRTDKEGWRYAVDYVANFGPAMQATSLVRRRKYYRTAVYVGGGASPDDDAAKVIADIQNGKGQQHARDAVGNGITFAKGNGNETAANGGSFVIVTNTGGEIKVRTGHVSDDEEEGFESCDSTNDDGSVASGGGGSGGKKHRSSKKAKKNDLDLMDPNDPDFQHYRSAEAQRQAAIAALASMKRKEERDAEAAQYFPKDNKCATAAQDGDEFHLPTTFEAGGKGGSPADAISIANKPMQTTVVGKGSHIGDESNDGSSLVAERSSYGFRVPTGPYMAFGGGGNNGALNTSTDGDHDVGLTRDASMQLNIPQMLTTPEEHVGVDENGRPRALSNGSSNAMFGHHQSAPNLSGSVVGTTSTSAAEFDAVFRAFVAKESH